MGSEIGQKSVEINRPSKAWNFGVRDFAFV